MPRRRWESVNRTCQAVLMNGLWTLRYLMGNQRASVRIFENTMTRNALCTSALALLAAVLVHAQLDHSPNVDRLDSIVEGAFKATHCPGLSVAVAKEDAIIYSKTIGLADL